MLNLTLQMEGGGQFDPPCSFLALVKNSHYKIFWENLTFPKIWLEKVLCHFWDNFSSGGAPRGPLKFFGENLVLKKMTFWLIIKSWKSKLCSTMMIYWFWRTFGHKKGQNKLFSNFQIFFSFLVVHIQMSKINVSEDLWGSRWLKSPSNNYI